MRINKKNFVGKTIKSIDIGSLNVVMFYFTDGSSTALETIQEGYGITGIAEYPLTVYLGTPKKK